jgi:two-component system, chemotaxis family, response regulator Rcp1
MNNSHSDPVFKILVIEDNPADVELLRLALESANLAHELTAIHDGGEALARFKRGGGPADQMVPDLVILDLNLPKYDGLEILEAARSNPAFAKLPILVLSSSSSPREITRVQAFGLVRFVHKPADLDRYMGIGDIIKDFLTGKEG